VSNPPPVKVRKKLIEVALPLNAVNAACIAEASPFTPRHPRSLHVWWARRRLAAARAVIFAQMVDDPSANPDLFPIEKAQEKERKRLFRIIEELVQWESTTNEEVLQRAREEIWQSWRRACADNAGHPRAKELFDRNKLPAFHDPFAGGGAIPLEAQRLGLEAYASDLNPVAVLICKAMIEIPSRFADKPPINPESRGKLGSGSGSWQGARGLSEDIRYYAQWIRDEAAKRIGYLYPKIEITDQMARERKDIKPLVGKSLVVTAWLWARTAKSPNPAFRHVDVPLVSSFILSTRQGKEAYVDPVIQDGGYQFVVRPGKPKAGVRAGTKLARGPNFECIMSGVPIAPEYIYNEGIAQKIGSRLMAIVAEGERGRVFLSPTADHEAAARSIQLRWKPDVAMPDNPRWFSPPLYGFKTYADLFTPRQLTTLTVFSDLIADAAQHVRSDALAAGLVDDGKPLRDGGSGVSAYAEAVELYLGLAISRWTDLFSSFSAWNSANQNIKNLFSRQAIPMVWDYAESNPFGSGASFSSTIETIFKLFVSLPATPPGHASQIDARVQSTSTDKVISTDPPYFDNIGYAELSEFFYVWLRYSLQRVYPDLFTTIGVPKDDELVAAPWRQGGKNKAEKFFLDGMAKAMGRLAGQAHPAFPITIYYAFKQTESDGGTGTVSTGWETFLNAVTSAGLSISGTWPIRTERTDALKKNINALASSVVLVCRPILQNAPTATRREFMSLLQKELPKALRHLQAGNIAPVDLAQAAIGPGMAVFTRYAKVLDAQDKPLRVRDALTAINEVLDEALAEQEGDFDSDTRWALAWFEQYGFSEGQFGIAETLSKAKNTSVSGIVDAGIARSKAGKVRLLKPAELSGEWDPQTDLRRTTWEAVHHLIRALESGGEVDAAEIAAKLGATAETARELCYRLYALCERKKRAPEALSYNGLVQSWSEIMRMAKAQSAAVRVPVQQELV
jgi:putative DNA methylase